MNFSKTKLFAALSVLLTAAQSLGIVHVTPECFQALQAIFGGGVIFGFRDAVGKIGKAE